MKPVSDRTAKRRLLQLADFLENEVPEKHFDFSTFGSVKNEVRAGTDVLEEAEYCGTTACALGWAPALPFAKRMGVKLQLRDREESFAEFTYKGRPIDVDKLSRLLFGLGNDSFGYIFYGSSLTAHRDWDGHEVKNEKSTARDVARGIREFVAIRFG